MRSFPDTSPYSYFRARPNPVRTVDGPMKEVLHRRDTVDGGVLYSRSYCPVGTEHEGKLRRMFATLNELHTDAYVRTRARGCSKHVSACNWCVRSGETDRHSSLARTWESRLTDERCVEVYHMEYHPHTPYLSIQQACLRYGGPTHSRYET